MDTQPKPRTMKDVAETTRSVTAAVRDAGILIIIVMFLMSPGCFRGLMAHYQIDELGPIKQSLAESSAQLGEAQAQVEAMKETVTQTQTVLRSVSKESRSPTVDSAVGVAKTKLETVTKSLGTTQLRLARTRKTQDSLVQIVGIEAVRSR
ncbi:MAG: hypothetical protein H7X80_04550 [bacterium]|nr:hypothetical protein [Candidatus Kapabacteria bacterium]